MWFEPRKCRFGEIAMGFAVSVGLVGSLYLSQPRVVVNVTKIVAFRSEM